MAEGVDHFLRSIEIAVADQRNPLQMHLDLGDAIPVGGAAEHVGGGAAMHGERRCAGPFDHLGDVAGIDRLARAAQANLGRDGSRGAGSDDLLDDFAHPIGMLEQIGTAVGLLRHLPNGAAEVDVDDAHARIRRRAGPPPWRVWPVHCPKSARPAVAVPRPLPRVDQDARPLAHRARQTRGR